MYTEVKIASKIKLITNKQQISSEMQKSVIFAKRGLKINVLKIKNIAKLETIVIMLVNVEVAKWPVWQNGWVFIYKLSGCGFETSCNDLNFRYCVCFEQGVPWHSGIYRIRIHSETRTWHDKNIEFLIVLSFIFFFRL